MNRVNDEEFKMVWAGLNRYGDSRLYWLHICKTEFYPISFLKFFEYTFSRIKGVRVKIEVSCSQKKWTNFKAKLTRGSRFTLNPKWQRWYRSKRYLIIYRSILFNLLRPGLESQSVSVITYKYSRVILLLLIWYKTYFFHKKSLYLKV